MNYQKFIEFENCDIKIETEKAILAVIENRSIWLPLSQITVSFSHNKKGDDIECTIKIPEWLAREKDLI